jgi:hypothetical protein
MEILFQKYYRSTTGKIGVAVNLFFAVCRRTAKSPLPWDHTKNARQSTCTRQRIDKAHGKDMQHGKR